MEGVRSESELGRLARLEDAEGSAEMLAAMPDDSPLFKLGLRAVTPTAEFGNRTDVLKADIPAGGKTSARDGAHVRRAAGRGGRRPASLA